MSEPDKFSSRLIFLTGLHGAIAVAMGAFGAHALKGNLSEYSMQIFQTGVMYHFYHLLALPILAWLAKSETRSLNVSRPLVLTSAVTFNLGIVLFSGSLYLLALGAPKWVGFITPLGGVNLILAWAILSFLGLRAATHK